MRIAVVGSIKMDHIKTVEGIPTGIAIITLGESDNTIVVVSGANSYADRAYIDSIKGGMTKKEEIS